jgi:hypothetical protein
MAVDVERFKGLLVEESRRVLDAIEYRIDCKRLQERF